MQTARVITVAPEGLSGRLITVEVAARPGISSLKIVGLAGRTVAEAKERVRVALRGCGVRLPATNIVVNLAPAEVAKTGTHYDLPIALGLLIATGSIPANSVDGVAVAAELALNGDLRSYQHSSVIAFTAEQSALKLLTAPDSLPTTGLAQQLPIATQPNLAGLIEQIKTGQLEFSLPTQITPPPNPSTVKLEDLAGLELPKRALTLAVAGQHHLLLCGPPGVGKSLLASAAPSLMSPLDDSRRRVLTALHGRPTLHPPFRAPHHSATVAALLGGGSDLHPGELSLAHQGVLFLDELPRFSQAALQSLLEPLETGEINLSRDGRSVTYPAETLVIGAFNPCPCGYYGHSKISCRCSQYELSRYQSRLSGPLISRFTLFAPCRSSNDRSVVTTDYARSQIAHSREQIVRRHQLTPNGRASTELIQHWLKPHPLAKQADQLLQGGRSWRTVINAGRLARTIADCDGRTEISEQDLVEAIGWLPPINEGA